MNIPIPDTRVLGRIIYDESRVRFKMDENHQEIKGPDGKPIIVRDRATQLPVNDVTLLVKQEGSKRYETIRVRIVSSEDPGKGIKSKACQMSNSSALLHTSPLIDPRCGHGTPLMPSSPLTTRRKHG